MLGPEEQMTMRRIMATVLALALAACSGTTEVTESDDGGSVSVGVGEEFTVALPANPTTGFTWMVVRVDADVFEQVDETEFVPDSDALGAGGTLTYHFEGRAEGTGQLVLEYRRPFENVAPEATFTLTVNVG
jgi:inhibitor of cysteine peptidase